MGGGGGGRGSALPHSQQSAQGTVNRRKRINELTVLEIARLSDAKISMSASSWREKGVEA